MRKTSSISTRFVVAAASSALIVSLILIGLVVHQGENSLSRRTVALEKISDNRLAAELDAHAELAAIRMRALFDDAARRVDAIAARFVTQKTFMASDVIAERLNPAARNANIDSIVMIDRDARAIGASSGTADLVSIGKKLETAPFIDEVRALMKGNSPTDPTRFSLTLMASEFGDLLSARPRGAASQMVFAPLFDESGEVSGGLIAQKWMRQYEPTLVRLAKIGSVSFSVFAAGSVVSKTGLAVDSVVASDISRQTDHTIDGRHIARCNDLVSPFRICALKSFKTLHATQDQITGIANEEQQRLLHLLIVFAIVTSTVLTVLSAYISRQITRPLRRISEALADVAAGRYGETVDAAGCTDDVGDVARAVGVLQASFREQDTLRANIEIKNATLRRQEGALREQNTLFDAALNNMSHGLCMFDANRHLIVSNQRYLELFSLSPHQAAPGMSWAELFSQQDAVSPKPCGKTGESLPDCSEWSRKRRSSVTYKFRSGRVVHMTRQPLADGGWVAIFDDVTERELARDRLVHLANHDALTNLPNRVRFSDHLEALAQRRNNDGGSFGILCLDLDEFKAVNDSLGHPVGDTLLREVAERLLSVTSDEDLVARMGGDEFAIITGGQTDVTTLAALANDAIEAVSRPYRLEDHDIAVGVSVGISYAQGADVDAEDLLKQADLALYQAKNDGRNAFRFFETEMELSVHHRRDLTADLRLALVNREFEAYFQPQINLSTGEISGFEALMRWNHPQRGLVSPADFIPIAEETGLIVPMGEWILREACGIAASWPEHIRIAVNISVKQLQRQGFTPTLMHALAVSGLPADRLELEVTESVLLGEDDETRKSLLRFKELGVKISMDDFGTGYSSLSCLRSFPFDKIKIDQSFIRTMADSDDSASIVRAIIDLAKSLKITTTAEGVESENLVGMLKTIGCTEVQGYLYGRPEPAAATGRRIRQAFPMEESPVSPDTKGTEKSPNARVQVKQPAAISKEARRSA